MIGFAPEIDFGSKNKSIIEQQKHFSVKGRKKDTFSF